MIPQKHKPQEIPAHMELKLKLLQSCKITESMLPSIEGKTTTHLDSGVVCRLPLVEEFPHPQVQGVDCATAVAYCHPVVSTCNAAHDTCKRSGVTCRSNSSYLSVCNTFKAKLFSICRLKILACSKSP